MLIASAAAFVCVLLLMFALLAAIDSGRFDTRLARFASDRLKRPVAFGALKTHLLSSRPTITVTRLRIGNPAWAGPGDLLQADLVRLTLRWPTFSVVGVEVERPRARLLRVSRERNNWSSGKGGGGDGLASIQQLHVTQGSFVLEDRVRDLRLSGTVTHDAALNPARPLVAAADGVLKGGEIRLNASGGPLNGRPRNAPYPFTARLQDGATVVEASGTSAKPAALKDGFDLRVAARGPNLANMKYLISVGLPNSAPYRLTAHLTRKGRTTRATDLKATVGQSDFTGFIVSDGSKARRLITIDLDSRTLHAADVAAFLADRPTHQLTRSVSGARTGDGGGRLLTTTPIDLKRFRLRDYRLNIDAQRFVIDGVAPGKLTMVGRLDRGRFDLKPVTLVFPSGRADGALWLDVNGKNPAFRLNGSLRRAALASLVPELGKTIGGTADLRFALAGAGASFRDISANATGRISLDLRDGQIQKSKANVISGAVVQGAFDALANKKATTELSCAVVRMDVGRGRVSTRRILLVTDVGTAVATGGIDLASETLDMTIFGRPSRFRLFTVDAPVSLTGSMLNPEVKVRLGGAPAGSPDPPRPPKVEGDRAVYCAQQIAAAQ